MSDSPHHDWSPADNPYAIALSEAQWWQRAVHLAVVRLQDPVDPRSSPFSSHQIDARNLVLALGQLLKAEHLEQVALKELAVDLAVVEALSAARTRYVDGLPGISEMRNALTHFDEWSRGEGRGPQKELVGTGKALRDVASAYWGFSYDAAARTVALGPHRFNVDTADQAAADLSHAIYMAAREVDRK